MFPLGVENEHAIVSFPPSPSPGNSTRPVLNKHEHTHRHTHIRINNRRDAPRSKSRHVLFKVRIQTSRRDQRILVYLPEDPGQWQSGKRNCQSSETTPVSGNGMQKFVSDNIGSCFSAGQRLIYGQFHVTTPTDTTRKK